MIYLLKQKMIIFIYSLLIINSSLYSYNIVVDKELSSKDKGIYITPAMVKIEAGSFLMGNNNMERNEKPAHNVMIKKAFLIGKYEVMVKEFKKFIEDTAYKTDSDKQGYCWLYNTKWKRIKGANWQNPGFEQSLDNPVTCVSWNDSKAYAKWLSIKTNKRYKLPSETQWEYVARAGSTSKYSYGSSFNSLGDYGWYLNNSNKKTHKVGKKRPNLWWIYDIHGNVYEWCEDSYVRNYNLTPRDEKAYIINKSHKVLRGGSWGSFSSNLSSTNRYHLKKNNAFSIVGFRLVQEF